MLSKKHLTTLLILSLALIARAGIGGPIELLWVPHMPGQLFFQENTAIHAPALDAMFERARWDLTEEADPSSTFAEDLHIYNDAVYNNRPHVLRAFFNWVLRLSRTPMDRDEQLEQIRLLHRAFPHLFTTADEPFTMLSLVDQEVMTLLQETLYDFLQLWIELEGGIEHVGLEAGAINDITGRRPHDQVPYYHAAEREFNDLEDAIANWADTIIHAAMTAYSDTEPSIFNEEAAHSAIEHTLMNIDVSRQASIVAHAAEAARYAIEQKRKTMMDEASKTHIPSKL